MSNHKGRKIKGNSRRNPHSLNLEDNIFDRLTEEAALQGVSISDLANDIFRNALPDMPQRNTIDKPANFFSFEKWKELKGL